MDRSRPAAEGSADSVTAATTTSTNTASSNVNSSSASADVGNADAVERLASIKERLAAISSKHASRKRSTDSLAQILASASALREEQQRTLQEQELQMATAMTTSPSQSSAMQATLKREGDAAAAAQLSPIAESPVRPMKRRSSTALMLRLADLVSLPTGTIDREPTCSCAGIILSEYPTDAMTPTIKKMPSLSSESSSSSSSSSETSQNSMVHPAICQNCHGVIRPIYRIVQEKAKALTQLLDVRKKLMDARLRERQAEVQSFQLTSRMEELEDLMDAKAEETQRLRRDLQSLSEKVVDEIEKRAELQASKDALQDELEELTKSLFEQANVLVADEARRRHLHEVREKALEQDIAELQLELNREQKQLRELKAKMEEAQRLEQESAYEMSLAESENSDGSTLRGMIMSSAVADPLDSLLLAEFKEFMSSGPTIKANKLHTLAFMKNALEDDVTPTLRFGGNPRTSTRRLIDAIVAGSCYVEEMTPTQIQAIQQQHQILREAAQAAANLAQESAAASDPLRKTRTYATPGPSAPYSLPSYTLTSSTTASSSPPTAHVLPAETEKALQVASAAPTQAIFQKTMLERLSTWTGSGLGGVGATTPRTPTTPAPTTPGGALAVGAAASGGSPPNSPLPATANLPVGLLPTLPSSLVVGGCSTCGRTPYPTRHHFKITDHADDAWCPICEACRDRLVAVCEFYAFIGKVRKGLYSGRRHEDLYLEVLALKRKMFYARIGSYKMAGNSESVFGKPGEGRRFGSGISATNSPADVTAPAPTATMAIAMPATAHLK